MDNDFNIDKVDFYNLDIDKYLEWLTERLRLISGLNEMLPSLVDLRKSWQLEKYRVAVGNYNYYDQSRLKKLLRLYDKKIQHFEIQEIPYKEVISDLYYYTDIEKYDPIENKNTYGGSLYSMDELKQHYLSFSVLFNLLKHDDIDEFRTDMKKEFERMPYNDENKFYQYKVNQLKDWDFKYLPYIITGRTIYDLNNGVGRLDSAFFVAEIEQIRKIIYLETLIKGEAPQHDITKPLQWMSSKNAIVTLFNELHQSGIIKGSKVNLERLILKNFVDADNKPMSKNTISEVFKKYKEKANKKVISSISSLIQSLKI